MARVQAEEVNAFVEECVSVLERTPACLAALLGGLTEVWTEATEGPGTWSPRVVLGHLVQGEQTDWIPRMEIILRDGEARAFDPFDREAQFRDRRGLGELVAEFGRLRRINLERLRSLRLDEDKLSRQGTHPMLGTVTARQLLATWTAHDLAHLLQISRTMAKRLRGEVGPWAEFLSVMKS